MRQLKLLNQRGQRVFKMEIDYFEGEKGPGPERISILGVQYEASPYLAPVAPVAAAADHA